MLTGNKIKHTIYWMRKRHVWIFPAIQKDHRLLHYMCTYFFYVVTFDVIVLLSFNP